MGLPSEDQSTESPCPVPYIVGFEAPVVVCPPEIDLKEPLKLRWVPPTAASGSSTSGSSSRTGTTSGSSSAGSSRSRSLSGAGGAGERHSGPLTDVDFGAAREVMMINDHHHHHHNDIRIGRQPNGIRSTSVDYWDQSLSGPPSPDSCGEDNGDDFFKSFRNHRRVESDG